MHAGTALKSAGIKPITLEAKEGLSLVNGTQAMLSLGLLALREAEILANTADVAGALSLDSLRGSTRAFDERLHAARPHPGQMISARNLSGSIAAAPSINPIGAARACRTPTACAACRRFTARCATRWTTRDGSLEIEMNSATDNPLVFADDREVISGGNFHGQPHRAGAGPDAAIALTQLGGIAERRVDRMVNPLTSELAPVSCPHSRIGIGADDCPGHRRRAGI